jgi:hypothetical protein
LKKKNRIITEKIIKIVQRILEKRVESALELHKRLHGGCDMNLPR